MAHLVVKRPSEWKEKETEGDKKKSWEINKAGMLWWKKTVSVVIRVAVDL